YRAGLAEVSCALRLAGESARPLASRHAVRVCSPRFADLRAAARRPSAQQSAPAVVTHPGAWPRTLGVRSMSHVTESVPAVQGQSPESPVPTQEQFAEQCRAVLPWWPQVPAAAVPVLYRECLSRSNGEPDVRGFAQELAAWESYAAFHADSPSGYPEP